MKKKSKNWLFIAEIAVIFCLTVGIGLSHVINPDDKLPVTDKYNNGYSDSYEDEVYIPKDEPAVTESPKKQFETLANIPSTYKLRPNYDEGTNGKLEGNITLVCIYASDSVSSWDTKDAFEFTDEYVAPAMKFIVNEAERHGEDLSIEIYEEFVTVNYTLSTNGSGNFEIKPVSQYMGYENEWEMFSAMSEKYDSNVAFMIICNKEGNAFTALSSQKYFEETGIFLTEYGMIYAPSIKDDGLTLTRVFLTLYGAQYCYSPDSREEIAREYIPRDVMLGDYTRLRDMEISDPTAFSLGWIKNPPDEICFDGWWSDGDKARFD